MAINALSAAEGVAVSRRDRLNLSGHGLPAPLFILAFVSGVVLCLNAIAIAVNLNDWVAVIVGGLVILIALDLALVLAISDPFRGPMRVLPTPIERLLSELEGGRFGFVGAAEVQDIQLEEHRSQPTRSADDNAPLQ